MIHYLWTLNTSLSAFAFWHSSQNNAVYNPHVNTGSKYWPSACHSSSNGMPEKSWKISPLELSLIIPLTSGSEDFSWPSYISTDTLEIVRPLPSFPSDVAKNRSQNETVKFWFRILVGCMTVKTYIWMKDYMIAENWTEKFTYISIAPTTCSRLFRWSTSSDTIIPLSYPVLCSICMFYV